MTRGEGSGWHGESRRHAEAAKKGTRTKRSPLSEAYRKMNLAYRRLDRADGEMYIAEKNGDQARIQELNAEMDKQQDEATRWSKEHTRLLNQK